MSLLNPHYFPYRCNIFILNKTLRIINIMVTSISLAHFKKQ